MTPLKSLAITTAWFAVAAGDTALANAGKSLPETKKFQDAVSKGVGGKALSDGDKEGKLGTAQMKRANKVAAEVLKRRMERRRPEDLKLLNAASEADVVVVRGQYDRVQDVLRAGEVKHVVVPPRLVERLPLLTTQTLMVNCPGRLGKGAIDKIRTFVNAGGYLVTTDWAIDLLHKTIPGYVRRGNKNTRNDVVQVQVLDGENAWLAGARATNNDPRWWLEGSSYPIRILNKQQVKVLISSVEMRKKYGHAPIAVAFAYGDGHVLHMTSHFYLQQAKLVSQREKANGSSWAKSAGMSAEEIAELKKKGLDGVRTGELDSAYSMQQVTANVIVTKQRANKKMLSEQYRHQAKKPLTLQAGPASKKPASKDSSVDTSYRLRILERKGKRVRVRDLFGREGWTDAELLEKL